MAATLELKYFNSFWLKKMDSIVDVVNTANETDSLMTTGSTTMVLAAPNLFLGVGQSVEYFLTGVTDPFTNIILNIDVTGTIVTLLNPVTTNVPINTKVFFGPIQDFTHVPAAYPAGPNDWYVEEARIRGGYNNTSVDFGVKAYLVEDSITQQHRFNSLIYSGIFNSRTGINNTNQFSVADDITRSLDPNNGSIQKLYAEDTNLIIFQESKVSRALIDKDAIYSAEGQPMTTSGSQVIGQVQQYAGNYGISTNPESFAVYGYRKYFVDRNQNVVLRLSQDGITEISAYGMIDYFRDNLALVGGDGRIIGGWDIYNKQYVLSLQPYKVQGSTKVIDAAISETLSFDEDSLGWTSRFSYLPVLSGSLRNNFYTFKKVSVVTDPTGAPKTQGTLWRHYADPNSTFVNYCNFYGVQYDASVTLIFNPDVSLVKNFNTINYEGSTGWALESLYSNTDVAVPIGKASNALNLAAIENQLFENNFKRKENKYFATIINNTPANFGEITFDIYGKLTVNGIKGFYSTVKMVFVNSTLGQAAELYSVSSNYVESSY
jgi:hypothetical protein